MVYEVKEIFYSLQGEGAQSGRPAVFCRFSGCNLWSGRESDRANAACPFCDTDFDGGERFGTPNELAEAIVRIWPDGKNHPLVICTGGEPLLQLDNALIDALHSRGFEIAVETNGTILPPDGLDWICVSPKAGVPLVLTWGNELKLVYPQQGIDPMVYLSLDFRYFFLQPQDGPFRTDNTQATIEYCLRNPPWRLSLQTHKIVGLP